MVKTGRRSFMKTCAKSLGFLAGASAGGLFLPKKAFAEDETKINPFVRPNINSLNYYGSGILREPLAKPVTATQEDYKLMEQNIQAGNIYDYYDTNGDGNVNLEDLVILGNNIEHGTLMPGDWNNLQTKEQRISWLKKMLAIDKTNEIPYKKDVFDCHQHVVQALLKVHGYAGDDIPAKFDKTNLGRFNLPAYYAYINIENNPIDHALIVALVGDENNGDPRIFNNLYFAETIDDTPVYPGYVNMPKNSEITLTGIKNFVLFPDGTPSDQFRGIYLVSFKLNGTTPEIIEDSVNPNLILQRPPIEPSQVAEQTPSQFVLKQNYPNPFNANTTIEYSLNESGKTTLNIYNIKGQHIDTLVNDFQSAGKHIARWKADNYSSGEYIARLRMGNNVETKKMMLIK